MAHLDGYRHFPPAVFWVQHYEHRVTFPEMVFAMDWLFLKGQEFLPLVLTGVLNLAVWAMFAFLICDANRARDHSTWAALYLAGAVMFWPGVAFVLAFPFSLQFVMAQFAATASYFALTRGYLKTAIAFAILATFSSANGLFAWPLLLALALVLRLGRERILVVLLSSALTSAVFFTGYRHLGNTHVEWIVQHPVKVTGYFLAYLGMPLGAASTWFSVAAGAGSLLIFAAAITVAYRENCLQKPTTLILAAVIIQTLATAAVTSVSRVPLDRVVAQAIVIPGRYVNFGAHYWAALLLLAFTVLRSRGAQWVTVACFSCAMGAAFLNTGPWIRAWMNHYALYQAATVAIEAGVISESALRSLNYADGSLVLRSLPELQRNHLALYGFSDYVRVGTPVSQFRAIGEVPRSAITAIDPVPGGFRIVGWRHPAPARLAVTDARGVAIGVGSHVGAGFPAGLTPPPGHEHEAFLAYAGPSFQPAESHVLVIR